ncbi:virulence factor MVIN family protein [Caballeronia hypogeia]|uniref:Virulence factor MVIN family protein n=1 Tax=Caballeronia hypogeia TaxID=1777140 RepID=A0A158CDZ0_9BURK|nr:lipid II flippase MurJ [Caballeronia hypogeia]SAK80529.1 virulence factor MVIN family protein [Caballeronia hypogeia]
MLTSAIGVLRRRFLNAHSDHRRIAKGAMIVSLFVFLGKGTGAFKEMAIAHQYGIGATVDAYQLALTLITFLPLVLTNELSVLLVPLFVRMRGKKEELTEFVSELETACLLLSIVLTGALLLAWPLIAHLIAGNLSEQTRQMCFELLVGISVMGVLSLTVCISAARLQASGKHINTLLESVPALVLLACILAMPNRHSLLPLMLGTSIGVALQALVLHFSARNADGVRMRFRLSFRSPYWRDTFHSTSMLIFGGIFAAMIPPLDQYFLAQAGDGAIATYGYAYRVLALVLGMGALAISRAILPILAEILAAKDYVRARDTAFKWSMVMLAVGSAGAALAWLLAPWIIELLFQRGAFTAEDTAAVTRLFRIGLLQVPTGFAALVILQLLVSEARYRALAIMSIAIFVIKVTANAILAPRYGAEGVLFATALMVLLNFLGYLACLRKPVSDAA